jgi:cytosine/uracil/thiamine/allantoin permease
MATQKSKVGIISREILGFLLHLLIAIVGGTCVGILLDLFFLEPLSTAHAVRRLPMLGFYNPIFWVSSLLLGLLVNYRTRHRSAYCVGIVGIAYLLFVLFSDKREFQMLFATDCTDGGCLAGLFLTLPILNLIGYSFGAWFGFRFAQETQRRKAEGTPLSPE